jgi:hypothetical protein
MQDSRSNRGRVGSFAIGDRFFFFFAESVHLAHAGVDSTVSHNNVGLIPNILDPSDILNQSMFERGRPEWA